MADLLAAAGVTLSADTTIFVVKKGPDEESSVTEDGRVILINADRVQPTGPDSLEELAKGVALKRFLEGVPGPAAERSAEDAEGAALQEIEARVDETQGKVTKAIGQLPEAGAGDPEMAAAGAAGDRALAGADAAATEAAAVTGRARRPRRRSAFEHQKFSWTEKPPTVEDIIADPDVVADSIRAFYAKQFALAFKELVPRPEETTDSQRELNNLVSGARTRALDLLSRVEQAAEESEKRRLAGEVLKEMQRAVKGVGEVNKALEKKRSEQPSAPAATTEVSAPAPAAPAEVPAPAPVATTAEAPPPADLAEAETPPPAFAGLDDQVFPAEAAAAAVAGTAVAGAAEGAPAAETTPGTPAPAAAEAAPTYETLEGSELGVLVGELFREEGVEPVGAVAVEGAGGTLSIKGTFKHALDEGFDVNVVLVDRGGELEISYLEVDSENDMVSRTISEGLAEALSTEGMEEKMAEKYGRPVESVRIVNGELRVNFGSAEGTVAESEAREEEGQSWLARLRERSKTLDTSLAAAAKGWAGFEKGMRFLDKKWKGTDLSPEGKKRLRMYKYALAAAAIAPWALGVLAPGMIVGTAAYVVAGVSLPKRLLAGAGTWVATETYLQKRREQKETLLNRNPKFVATLAALGVAFGLSFVAHKVGDLMGGHPDVEHPGAGPHGPGHAGGANAAAETALGGHDPAAVMREAMHTAGMSGSAWEAASQRTLLELSNSTDPQDKLLFDHLRDFAARTGFKIDIIHNGDITTGDFAHRAASHFLQEHPTGASDLEIGQVIGGAMKDGAAAPETSPVPLMSGHASTGWPSAEAAPNADTPGVQSNVLRIPGLETGAQPHGAGEAFNVHEGNSVWRLVRHRFEETGATKGMPPEQANKFIAAFNNRLARFSPDELRHMGFRPDAAGKIDINKIYPGDKLDLSRLLEDQKEMQGIFEHAGMDHATAIERAAEMQQVPGHLETLPTHANVGPANLDALNSLDANHATDIARTIGHESSGHVTEAALDQQQAHLDYDSLQRYIDEHGGHSTEVVSDKLMNSSTAHNPFLREWAAGHPGQKIPLGMYEELQRLNGVRELIRPESLPNPQAFHEIVQMNSFSQEFSPIRNVGVREFMLKVNPPSSPDGALQHTAVFGDKWTWAGRGDTVELTQNHFKLREYLGAIKNLNQVDPNLTMGELYEVLKQAA